jgi:hypothetical protein
MRDKIYAPIMLEVSAVVGDLCGLCMRDYSKFTYLGSYSDAERGFQRSQDFLALSSIRIAKQ